MQIKVERSKFRWIRKHLLHLSYKEVGDACKSSAYMVEKSESNRTCDPGIIEVLAEEKGKTTKAVFTGDLGNNDIPLLSSHSYEYSP